MKIVAVTACPTGIAHTYMAAEQLEKTARALGHTIKVETQGAMGIENELAQADIDAADVVLIAADSSFSMPIEPCVSTLISWPSARAVFSSCSAAM